MFFLFRSPLGFIVGLITTAVVGVVVLVGVVGVMAVSGGPAACTPGGGPITVGDANADTFVAKWDSLDASLAAGTPATIILNESELTSRAGRYIREQGIPIKNVRVCIHDAFGEVTGSASTVAGLNADFRVTGTVDITGEHPVVTFQEVEVGRVPGFALSPFKRAVESVIRDELQEIELDHTYLVGLSEGQAEIGGLR